MPLPAKIDGVSRLIQRLVYLQGAPLLGRPLRTVLKLYGVDIPPGVLRGEGLTLPHGGHGVNVHGRAEIGRDVTLYQNVTLGRADVWRSLSSDSGRIVIEQDAIICAGAVVLLRIDDVIVGKGTVIGANAVLTQSTGAFEIWAGAPAKRVGLRSA
jgi:serine O-acetyltransferase